MWRHWGHADTSLPLLKTSGRPALLVEHAGAKIRVAVRLRVFSMVTSNMENRKSGLLFNDGCLQRNVASVEHHTRMK